MKHVGYLTATAPGVDLLLSIQVTEEVPPDLHRFFAAGTSLLSPTPTENTPSFLGDFWSPGESMDNLWIICG